MEPYWVVLLALAALLVRTGQMLGAMGIARAKNVASAGLRSLGDLCIATLCFWAVGAAITFQTGNPIFGINASYLIGWSMTSATPMVTSTWYSTLAVILIGTGIIAPALAERSRLRVPLAIGGVLAGILIPLVWNWTRFGWLANLRFIDAGGAAAIHLTPAICAAIAALFVGPREGKYNRDGSSNMIPGHSVLMILFSVMLIFVGWAPYIIALAPAAIPAQVASNVMVAAAASGLASLIVGHIRFGKADVILTCSGILGGLVSITAGAAVVSSPAAFLIGLIAGLLIPYVTVMIDLRLKLDDPGGVVAVHGIGAIWALLAAPIFATALTIAERLRLLGIQAMGVFIVLLTISTLMLLIITFLKLAGNLRSREADEYDGLDLADHDINAHPDFQQTMIKSYHLREA